MIRLECDYTEGAHPQILTRLVATNLEQTPGYGDDPYCQAAADTLRKACEKQNLAVHFLVGGTQANTTVIAFLLRPHQGVIAAHTGHVCLHETGAIEATGHKVLPLPSSDGKITAKQIQTLYEEHWQDVTHEHMVQPGMVYLSQPTENGTLYSKSELTAISQVCSQCGLPLYLDGARLGYALAAPGNDLFLPDLARLCDIFYIGGTKVGALFGEAVIIANPDLGKDFRYQIKQRGGLLAKGRLLGIQFDTLFRDGLYLSLADHAVQQALRIRKAFAAKGFSFLYDSPTNQQFPILPKRVRDKLSACCTFSFWCDIDEDLAAVRFCTSWATQSEQIDQLIACIADL